jgi:hypothetical protein
MFTATTRASTAGTSFAHAGGAAMKITAVMAAKANKGSAAGQLIFRD